MRIPFILLCLIGLHATTATVQPQRIHVISGAREYDSEGSLQAFTQWLEPRHRNLQFSFSWGHDGIERLENLKRLADADLLLIYARRMRLDDEDMERILQYWDAGKPIIGMRTASHAFQEAANRRFDQEILGGDYDGHYGNEPVRIVNAPIQHPVLEGVGAWESSRLYKQGELASDVLILQWGQGASGREPVTWVRKNGPRRTFYTSLGTQADFERLHFKKLMENAILWSLGDFVGEK